MVIDSSALVALANREPEAAQFAAAINADPIRYVSVATLVETSIVLRRLLGDPAVPDLDRFLLRIGASIRPVDREQAEAARDAHRRFGRGRHPAGLNFGDCFSYALSKVTGEPLLFKGDDFAGTDVAAVPLAPD